MTKDDEMNFPAEDEKQKADKHKEHNEPLAVGEVNTPAPQEASSGNTQDAPRESRHSKVVDLITNALDKKLKTASTQLKELLQGKLGLNIRDSRKTFAFEWVNNDYQIKELQDNEPPSSFECHMSISEKNMKEVLLGDLNPQLAIISGKIAVSGKFSMAIYFFNLVSPK